MKVLKNYVCKCLRYRKVLDIVLLRPATCLQLIVEVVKVMGIGLKRPEFLPQVIAEVVDLGQVWPDTIPLVITVDMLIEVNLDHKRPVTLPLAIGE